MPKKRRTKKKRAAPPRTFLQRRSTKWLFAAIITLAIAIGVGVLGSLTGGSEDRAFKPTPTLAVGLPGLAPESSALQRAEVVDVIDGDTIDVVIDGRSERVRYYGIDAPERGERCYEEASDRNEALVGGDVLLLPDVREHGPFDRLLRYAFDMERRSIDARLIAEGLAVAWREDGAFRDELLALEEEARSAKAGCLWEG